MRHLIGLFTWIIILIAVISPGVSPFAAAQGNTPGGESSEPVHLVVNIEPGGVVRINRMDWDVNAFAPVFAGASVRSSDYVDLSGRTTVLILCTDLALIEQRGSEVPRCDAYPRTTAFFYADDPAWLPPDSPAAVVVQPGTQVPTGIDAGAFNLDELSGSDLDAVTAQVDTILGLNLSAEPIAFALASFYRGQGMTFDALSVLNALPDLECSAQRPTVEPPQDGDQSLVKSPALYLRIGELYQMLGDPQAALRHYQCAARLAQALDDPADLALASARQANAVPSSGDAVALYQQAINQYATLGATSNATALLEICGLRNCAMP